MVCERKMKYVVDMFALINIIQKISNVAENLIENVGTKSSDCCYQTFMNEDQTYFILIIR
jgi:hypothetical protein